VKKPLMTIGCEELRYVGSIEYDDHNDAWCDQVVRANDYQEFLSDLTDVIKRRKNASVFFALEMRDNYEKDITEGVKNAIRVDQ